MGILGWLERKVFLGEVIKDYGLDATPAALSKLAEVVQDAQTTTKGL